jgi:hypothetical protein
MIVWVGGILHEMSASVGVDRMHANNAKTNATTR